MSISAIFGLQITPSPTLAPGHRCIPPPASTVLINEGRTTTTGGLMIECSSRPQKKATAHHRKTRPIKTQPWDKNRRGPTVYAPLPPLPPEWTLLNEEEVTSSSSFESPPPESS